MKFQYIFLTIFGLAAVVAVGVFAKFPASGDDPIVSGAQGEVVIWGTFEEGLVTSVLREINETYKTFSITYKYRNPESFDTEIIEALASGNGPDILLIPDDLLLRHNDKIERFSYAGFDANTFQNSFVQAAEMYMRPDGIIALPFAIDPMVMYWNRDKFNNISVTQPPKYWDELLELTPRLTKRNKNGDITESTLAFGEYTNVTNVKDILAMLFLQSGSPIVSFKGDKPYSSLVRDGNSQNIPNQDVSSAFRFFMDFSNPLKNIYTWNRALPQSREQFINGNLSIYFDFISEYENIKQENPHLNFAIAPVPQLRNSKVEISLAHVHGLAIMKSSKNKQTAFVAVRLLLDPKPSGAFANLFHLPPVRRDLLAQRPTDAISAVAYDAAIRARTWLDPRPGESDLAFKETIESVSSGRNDSAQAISYLSDRLNSILSRY